MSEASFRVWFGDRAASEDELARIEEIEVTQEMDAFWEARMRMAMCLDAQGRWQHRPDDGGGAVLARARRARHRQRQLRAADRRPARRASTPRSIRSPAAAPRTIVVRDDSVFLNRDEEIEQSSETAADSEIADELFRQLRRRSTTPASKRPPPHARTTTRRGTNARSSCASWRAPTSATPTCCRATEPGKSIGCFLPDPRPTPASCRRCVLIGDDRNLVGRDDRRGPARRPSARTRSMLRVERSGALATFETSAADLRHRCATCRRCRRT